MWQILSFLPGLYHNPSPSSSTTLLRWEHLKSILFPYQLLGSGNALGFPRGCRRSIVQETDLQQLSLEWDTWTWPLPGSEASHQMQLPLPLISD